MYTSAPIRFASVFVILVGFLGDCSAADAIEVDFPPERSFCVHPFWVEVGDWNRDGRDDVLAVANRRNVFEIGTAVGDDEGGFAGCSLFRQEMPLEIAFSPDGIVFGDFNEDGDLDVAATSASANERFGEFESNSRSI